MHREKQVRASLKLEPALPEKSGSHDASEYWERGRPARPSVRSALNS